MLATLAALLVLPLAAAPAQDAPGAPVSPGTPSAVDLRAPVAEDGFTFVLFGDRTGGPPEGIHVLEEGVRMANRLDPDFVMTVGDLVNGYNQSPEWLAQMREYKGAMAGLEAPWYPVCGNHDVYAREGPEQDHLGLYQEHFGPLYYSFDHRWAHFVCLFTDEMLSFADKARDQNFSAEQLEWLRRDLAATDAEQVFLFMHHPRWNYHGTNWPEVHELLVADGRCTAVFAGHVHRYRDDGERDGIHYYTMAGTGAYLGAFRETSAIQHVAQVSVRRDGIRLAVIPVGQLFGGDMVRGSEVDEMSAILYSDWLTVDGRAELRAAPAESSLRVHLTNPSTRALEWELATPRAAGWEFALPFDAGVLGPGEQLALELTARAPAFAGAPARPRLRATLQYRLESGLVQPLEASLELPLVLPELTAQAGPGEEDRALVLDGASALRVELPERLQELTLECWVKGEAPAERRGLACKTESSAFGLFWGDAQDPQPAAYLGLARLPATGARGYLRARASGVWPGEWTHLAMCYDGAALRLFVGGRLVAEQPGAGTTSWNGLPLYVGADVGADGSPNSFFRGAVDELRVSDVARYDSEFEPARVHPRDEHTVLLLHMDRDVHGVHPDDSGHHRHAFAVGRPRLEPSSR